MTVLDGGPTHPPVEPPPPQPIPEHFQAEPPDAGRASQWRTSWRLALRMARRDVRRNKGRTALAFAMIFLPTIILAAAVVLVATVDSSGARGIPYRLGDATAKVTHRGFEVAQNPDPGTFGDYWSQNASDDQAEPIDADETPSRDDQRDAIEAATGGTAYPFIEASARFTVGNRLRTDQVWLYDPSKLTGRATLISGRWPAGPDEVVVTDYGRTRGLPADGGVSLKVDMAYPGAEPGQDQNAERPLTVVGVARAKASPTSGSSVPAVIVPPRDDDLTAAFSSGPYYQADWFVMGGRPVTWATVKDLNAKGYGVTSALVLTNPPPKAEQYPPDPTTEGDAESSTAVITLFGYAFMAVVIALLVAPAFAVSAARSRRTLALAASNGARTADLRRTVLAQALVIAFAATVTSAVLGVGAVWAGGLISYRVAGYEQLPPAAVPWLSMFGMVAIGMASAIVAALIPANRLGRLDIISVMRGQVASARPSLIVFGLGLLVTLASAFALLGAMLTRPSAGSDGTARDSIAALTGLTLIGGSVFLVPMALAGLAKLGGYLPTAGSMAARDMGRHRARSAPTVAAVMAAAAALTLGLTLQQADATARERDYTPNALAGEGVLRYWQNTADDGSYSRALGPIKAGNRDLTFTEVKVFDDGTQSYDGDSQASIRVVPDGCTPVQTVVNPAYDAKLDAFSAKYQDQPPPGVSAPVNPCSFEALNLGLSYSADGFGTLVMPADWLVKRLDLNDAQAAALREGGIVYAVPKPEDLPIKDVSLAVLGLSYPGADESNAEEGDTKVEVRRQWTAPLIAVPDGRETSGALLSQVRAIASDGPSAEGLETRVGTETSLTHIVTARDGSAITKEQSESIASDLADAGDFTVETGHPDNPLLIVSLIVLGLFSFLVLLVVLTTTALSLAEQQRDQSTLAAVGATRGTRRVMAGVQAFLIAATGAVAGLFVGLIPAVALSYLILAAPAESDYGTGEASAQAAVPSVGAVLSTLTLPWPSLAIMAFGIPLVAGLAAAFGIRKAPMVARRAT